MPKMTNQDISKATASLSHALYLLEVLGRADIGLNQGETKAYCEVLISLIDPAGSVFDYLNSGYSIEPTSENEKKDHP
jgi:hypothetical protein